MNRTAPANAQAEKRKAVVFENRAGMATEVQPYGAMTNMSTDKNLVFVVDSMRKCATP
jgi:hypothetical protein